MNESRLDAWVDRLQRSGRFRAELFALLAAILLLGHTGTLIESIGLSKQTARALIVTLLVLLIAYRVVRMSRISAGNLITLQYHGWFRVGKLLKRKDELVLLKLFDEQYAERPRKVNVGRIKEQDRMGDLPATVMSEQEFEACEPKVIAYGEISDADEELIENLPANALPAAVHH